MSDNINLDEVPEEIVTAAVKICEYAARAGWKNWLFIGVSDRSYSEQLKRQRDEARKEIKELKFELALTGIPTTVEEVEREEWRQERDALRAEVERLKSERENWRVSSVCRKLRAEVNQLKADKARLDWLEKRESMEGFTRDAIDAAMKGEL